MSSDIFELEVQSRGGIIFKDKVVSITSFNETGKFDVLAEHANFISLITKSLIIRSEKGEVKKINFDNALIRVRQNRAEVYIGVQTLSDNQY